MATVARRLHGAEPQIRVCAAQNGCRRTDWHSRSTPCRSRKSLVRGWPGRPITVGLSRTAPLSLLRNRDLLPGNGRENVEKGLSFSRERSPSPRVAMSSAGLGTG